MRKYLLIVLVVFLLFGGTGAVQAEEVMTEPEEISGISAPSLLDSVNEQLDKVEDFRGEIRGKLYGSEDSFDFRAQVMQSETRRMTNTLERAEIENFDRNKLINSIPWLYFPPDFSTLLGIVPLEGKLDYDNPLAQAHNLYDLELMGEAAYQGRDVYIVQLRNQFHSQRLYIDKDRRIISRVEVFNSSNIRIANISYKDFEVFGEGIWLPTQIEVEEALGNKVLEVNYHDWEVNIGLTNIDFLEGFQDDYQARINELEEELEDNPNDDSLYWQISQIYKNNNEIESALSTLEEAIRLEEKAKYKAELGRLLRDKRNYEEAIQAVERSLQLDHNNAEFYHLLGELYLEQNNRREARRSFEQAVELEADNLEYLESLFRVYRNAGSEYMLGRAENIIEEMIELAPEEKNYRIYLGDIYYNQGKLIKAANAYNKAIELAPEDTWGYIKLANFYQSTGDYHKAEEIYRYVIYLDDTIANRRRLADLYFEYGRYRLALEEYRLINNRATNNYEVKLKLAEAYFAAGDNEAGLEVSYEILDNFSDGSIYLETAQRIREYDLESALEIYYQALQQKDDLSSEEEEKFYRGFSRLFSIWEQEKRLFELESLLELPGQAEVYNLLGQYHLKTGQVDTAVKNLKRAGEMNVQPEVHYNLALSYLIMEDQDRLIDQMIELFKLGELQKTNDLAIVQSELKRLNRIHAEKYLPGRLNRVAGDQLRKEGKLNQAEIEYKQAAYENYKYDLPYFYLAWIYSIQGEKLEAELAKAGVQSSELELLDKLEQLY